MFGDDLYGIAIYAMLGEISIIYRTSDRSSIMPPLNHAMTFRFYARVLGENFPRQNRLRPPGRALRRRVSQQRLIERILVIGRPTDKVELTKAIKILLLHNKDAKRGELCRELCRELFRHFLPYLTPSVTYRCEMSCRAINGSFGFFKILQGLAPQEHYLFQADCKYAYVRMAYKAAAEIGPMVAMALLAKRPPQFVTGPLPAEPARSRLPQLFRHSVRRWRPLID